MPYSLDFTIDADQLKAAFDKAPAITTLRLQEHVVKSSLKVERESKQQLRDKVSSAASGRTLNSIRTKVGVLEAETRPTIQYGKYTITGRRPGKMPPFQEGSDLANWARRAGVNPFLVARAIARKGTKGIPYMDSAYNNIKAEINKDAEDTVEKIIRDLL